MHLVRNTALLILLSAGNVFADFLGPAYPAPRKLASDKSLVAFVWKNLSSTIETYLHDSNTGLTGIHALKNITFSLGVFSTRDQHAAESLQFHYTSAEVANSTTGVTAVNGNSIYRVASITKLITIFAGMLRMNNTDWDRPIVDFEPTLAEYAQSKPETRDLVNVIQWDQVTLAALGAHMAGTPRDVIPYDPQDYLYTVPKTPDPIGTFGLPPLNSSDVLAFPPCANVSQCTRNKLSQGAQARPPVFLPWTSPSYTDFGFMLLGVAIANITGKSIHDVYGETIFKPLGMICSGSLPPQQAQWKKFVIPGAIENGVLTPEQSPDVTISSGGIYSSTNDLARLGTAILNHTLLPPDQTRKWMKQVSHTAGLQFSVGRPWEIYRYVHQPSGTVTDIYTKAGDSGSYGGYIALLPDFDAGFSILGASSLPQRSLVTPILADLVANTMLPALMAQAEVEAERNFAGTYVSTVAGLETTVTLALNRTLGAKPGLVITSFVSNGTDVLLTQVLRPNPVRLLPSISDVTKRQIAFRTSAYTEATEGLFSRQLNTDSDWLLGDSGTYGGTGVGIFLFDLDLEGKAVAVTPAGWRIKLRRQN